MPHRRDVLRAGVAAPLGLLASVGHRAAAAPPGTPPPYTLSINIEIMFNTGRGNPPMPRADRIRAVAAKGFKAYSYWNATPDERKAMIQAQQQTGLKCVSLVGTGNAGGTTGFTKPGVQDALLAEIKERVEIAKEFGTQPDLISFVGIIQPDVPWDTQRTQIIDGLKRAGDIAASAGVTIAVEPLSVNANQARRALDRQPSQRSAGQTDQARADRRQSGTARARHRRDQLSVHLQGTAPPQLDRLRRHRAWDVEHRRLCDGRRQEVGRGELTEDGQSFVA